MLADRRVGGLDPCPVTQERFWVLERAGCPGLWSAILLRIDGAFDRQRLASALALLWESQPGLGATFAVARGTLRKSLAGPPGLQEKRLASTTEPAELERTVAQLLAEPFDLECGPLYRTTLIATGPAHFLLLQAHAILLSGDGLLATVDSLAAACAGTTAPHPAPYSATGAAPAADAAGLAERWRARLQGHTGELHLPRKAASSAGPPRVQSHGFEIPADTRVRIERLAQGQGITLSAALLTAASTVLCRSSGQQFLTIGCAPRAMRAQPAARTCGGLPLPLSALPNDTFMDRIRRTGAALAAWAGEDPPPLALLYRVLRAPAPLFETTFDFVLDRPRHWLAGPMQFTCENMPPVLAPECGIGLSFDATAENLTGRLCFRTDRYDAALVEKLADQLLSLLEAVAANPEAPIEAMPLLSAGEMTTLLETWNATDHAYPRDMCVHELVRRAARRHGQAIAVQSHDETLTYAGLDASSDTVARHLRMAGAGPGTIVGLCMERSLHLVVGLLGILKAGAAYLPLDPAHPAQRLAFLVADAQVALVVTDGAARDTLPAAVRRLTLPLPAQPLATAGRPAVATDPAYVIYTSGSTGQPKGVLTSHRSLVNRLLWMQSAYAVTARDRFFQKTNFSFDVSVWEFLLPLISGARLVMARPGGQRDPDYLHAAMSRFGVTIVHFVPSALLAFLRATPDPLPDSVRLVVASGEALPAKLAREFLQRNAARLENLYGPTEAAIDVSSHAVGLDDAEPVPIGRPIWNTRLYVLDAARRPVAIGLPGELYIGGDGLALGYLNRPELTASRFLRDPFAGGDARMYRTGDLARWNERGEVEYLGRADDQVKVNGFRIELGEIATAAERHPSIRQAVALVVGEEESRRIILCVAATVVDAADIRNFLAQTLPLYMMPAEIMLLDTLPLTPNGKLDRSRLVARHAAAEGGLQPPAAGAAFDQALLDDLAAEWSHLSETAGTARSGDIFDHGATSLDAVELTAMIRGRYGAPFSLADLYAAPTLPGIASLVRSRGGGIPSTPGAGAGEASIEGWI